MFKKYLNIIKNIFNLNVSLEENGNKLKAYDISDKDIKEFFKHLKLSKKEYYTMAYFYEWHREYKDIYFMANTEVEAVIKASEYIFKAISNK